VKKKIIISIVIFIIVFIAVALIRSQHKTPNSLPVSKGEFLTALYKWVLKKAGGLADGTLAGDADLKRSPCTVTINGRTYNKPHTNKDITYPTFETLAPKFGYEVNCNNFIYMPDDLWQKIFYHIAIEKGLKFTDNIVLAAYIGSWYWGSGSISTANQDRIKAILADGSISDKERLRQLIDLRKSFFESLAEAHPITYGPALDGWLNRAEAYWNDFNQFVS